MPESCRACAGPVEPVVDLGSQPVQALFPRPGDAAAAALPLRLGTCTACGLAQLADAGPPEADDPDAPSPLASPTMASHARSWAGELVGRGVLGAGTRALSLASHGGHLAPLIRAHGGVTSSLERDDRRAAQLRASGEAVLVGALDDPGRHWRSAVGRFDLIVDSYLLAHLERPRVALESLAELLAPGGTLALEFDDLLATVIGGQWDAIGFGHPTHLSLGWLASELERLGLGVVDAEAQLVYGGSMRVYAQPTRHRGVSVSTLIAREAAWDIGRPQGLVPLADAAARARRDVVLHLRAARDARRPVLGYGAPARSITFLNALGIGPDLLPYVVDRAPAKQGRLIPGVGVPVRSVSALIADQPDEVLILAWNLAREIVSDLRTALPATRFLTAIPVLGEVTDDGDGLPA